MADKVVSMQSNSNGRLMRYLVVTIAMLLLLAPIACGQIATNPAVVTCPATSGTAYTPLNQNSPATGLSYTDNPAGGTWCYIAQSVIGTSSSVPSNVAMDTTTAADPYVQLNWQAPTTGPAPLGYVLSRAPAVESTLNAPDMGGGSVTATAALVKPALPEPNALQGPGILTARLATR